jgi:hypothetical protein
VTRSRNDSALARSTVRVVAVGALALACGGSASGPAGSGPATPSTPLFANKDKDKDKGSADGPMTAEKCLAIAGAKRERKPDEPQAISAKHLLVKYAGAKRAAPTVTRTREEACLRAYEARTKLEAGASFADVVKEYSEEPGAATREGSLGSIGRAHLAPPFADAAFELHVGEVSHVVETDFGFHVIQRTE